MTGAALGFLLITWAIVFSVAGISLKAIVDSEKKNNCKANGISLINIPIVPDKHRHNFKEFLSNVIMSCASNGLNIQFDDDQIKELENDFYTV